MSFPQQMGSDRAAAEAEARRRQLGERPARPATDHKAQEHERVTSRFLGWLRRTLGR